VLDFIARVLGSEVFRGGALFIAVISGTTAVILQFVRNRPTMAKIEDDARAALDASTHAELKRLAERLDQADARNKECEREQKQSRERIRELEDEIAGLRRQLLHLQETNLRVMIDSGTVPPDMMTTLRYVK
jgi:septal ring factor EnvC (AmiA/AmiB activator)